MERMGGGRGVGGFCGSSMKIVFLPTERLSRLILYFLYSTRVVRSFLPRKGRVPTKGSSNTDGRGSFHSKGCRGWFYV